MFHTRNSLLWRVLIVGVSIFVLGCQNKEPQAKSAISLSKNRLVAISPNALGEMTKLLNSPELVDSAFQIVIGYHLEEENIEKSEAFLAEYGVIRADNPQAALFMLNAKAQLLKTEGKLDSSTLLYQLAESRAFALGNQSELGKAQKGIGINYHFKGEYNKSAEMLKKAKATFLGVRDSAGFFYAVLFESSNLYRNERCAETVVFAKSIFYWADTHKDSNLLADAFNLAALGFECSEQFDSAMFYHQKALDIRVKLGKNHLIGESWNNIAVVGLKLKQYDMAIENLEKAISFMEKSKDKTNLAMLKSNLGQCYQDQKQYGKAFQLYNMADSILQNTGQLAAAIHNLNRLANLEKERGNYKDAVAFFEKGGQLRDTLSRDQQKRYLQKIETIQEEKKGTEEKLEVKSYNFYLLAGFTIIGIGALVLLSWFFRLRDKRKLIRSEQELLAVRQVQKDRDAEIAKMEADMREKLLDRTTTELKEKKELVNELTGILDSYKNLWTLEETDKAKSLASEEGIKILTKKDWKDFLLRYEFEFPQQISWIKEKAKNITEAELRLFLLLKLGYSTPEIAETLAISKESVSKTRHRLRKRFGLSETDNLEEFVENF